MKIVGGRMVSGIDVAIDPGVHGLGVSLFADKKLAYASFVTGLGGEPHPLLEISAGFISFLEREVGAKEQLIDETVIEIPKIYDTRNQKGRQSDIVKLAIAVGTLMHAIRPFTKALLPVEPATWKAQENKSITQQRVHKRLSKEELENIDLPTASSLHHNVYDSIGLGLWRLRTTGLRLDPTELVTHEEEGAINIGRPGPYGNPFKIGVDGTRDEVIAKFRKLFFKAIRLDKNFIKDVRRLKGKKLFCPGRCKPKACHGDVYIDFLDHGAKR